MTVHVTPCPLGGRFAYVAQEASDLRVFSVWSSPGLMAIWRKAAFAPIALKRQCVVFPKRPHWSAYELALGFMEELEGVVGQLVGVT
jgi:hypothetical protein